MYAPIVIIYVYHTVLIISDRKRFSNIMMIYFITAFKCIIKIHDYRLGKWKTREMELGIPLIMFRFLKFVGIVNILPAH